QLKDSDALLDINEIVPDGASQWEKSVVDLYTRDGGLWGVPQIWDSIALFYNKALVEEAGVGPTALAFDPAAESESLREAGAARISGARSPRSTRWRWWKGRAWTRRPSAATRPRSSTPCGRRAPP